MPKYVFKPSCSLSENSRKRRAKLNCANVINPQTNLTLENLPSTDNVTHNEHIVSTDSQYEILHRSNNVVAIEFDQNMPQKLNVNSNLDSKNVNSITTFQSQLATFVISSRLAKNKTNDLLRLLKSVDSIEYLQSLPLDSRTLLSTPTSGTVNISSIGGGAYIHFGLLKGLINLYEVNIQVQQLSVFELWFNIDGLPIDKQGSSLWPILCGVCVNSSVIPFIVGTYFGSKKSQNVHEYLSSFIIELKDLLQNGIMIGDTYRSITLKGIVADAPARSYIKQIKNHCGYYGCEKCVVKGKYTSVTYRNKSIGNICYANNTAELLTDESFVQRTNKEHHIGISPLLNIPGLGLVTCLPLDYMHLCCLGIMKKILRLIVNGSRSGSCGPTRLSKDQILCINKRMKIISKWLSADFVRVPTELNNYNTYKATELRQILMYTGPFLFKDNVTIPVYNNFITLNIAMRILACSKTVYSQNNFAKDLTKHFLKTFCLVYGQINASYNIHSVIHLADDAKKYGVIDSFSSFPYENYWQHIKKIIQPGRAPLVQLYNRIDEEYNNNYKFNSEFCTNYPFLDGHHSEGPLPSNLFNDSVTQYSVLINSKFTIRTSNKRRKSTKKDECVLISNNIVCIVKNILNRNGEIFLVCTKFKHIDSVYEQPCSSLSIGIIKCQNISSELELHHINSVQYKACYFPMSEDISGTTFYVCAMLHTIT